MLFSGCCAVRLHPAVCVWKRRRQLSDFFAPYLSFMCRAQIRLAARYFASSSKKFRWALKKNESLGEKASMSCPAATHAST